MAARLRRNHRLRDPGRARSLPGTRAEDGSIVMDEIQQSLQRRKLSDHQFYAELRGNEIAALPRDRAGMRTEQASRPPPRHVAMLNEIRGSLLPFANAEAIAQAEGAKGVDEEMLLALMDMGFDQVSVLPALCFFIKMRQTRQPYTKRVTSSSRKLAAHSLIVVNTKCKAKIVAVSL